MGMFDKLLVKCPTCECPIEFQSKAGRCYLDEYTLEDCPLVVLADVASKPPEFCKGCGSRVSVGVAYTAKVIVIEQDAS